MLYSVRHGVRSQKWESGRGPTSEEVVCDARFLWIVFRAVEVNVSWAGCSKNVSQRVCPVIAEVIGDDLDSRREVRGHCALGSTLKFGYRFHKSTRNVEWGHADVDVEHYLSESGASGGVESLEGKKHWTEVILPILLRREKITVLAGSNCLSGGTLLDDEVKGGDKGLEIPLPLGQFGITKPV